ncbi:hypothetical protein CQ13_29775 [Bradyrhizobium retamae]|uniref:Uncharacterized protein n=2 Tax=Bradyrhizobium retamae TaxID=1300035 RepID=A0A0R3MPX8_9BRAD|nr:hypothetical protein CQ13_29775 [Bradyrhizobium retamae]
MSTRPMFSKVSLAAFVLTLVLAANLGSKADDLLPQLRKNYEDCVYRAVRSQAEKLRSTGGTSEAIELAFEACQSEEREIVEHLNAIGMAPATVDKALRAFKLRLQKTVR